MEGLFDIVIDGIIQEALEIKPKPYPDAILKCCELVDLSPGNL